MPVWLVWGLILAFIVLSFFVLWWYAGRIEAQAEYESSMREYIEQLWLTDPERALRVQREFEMSWKRK